MFRPVLGEPGLPPHPRGRAPERGLELPGRAVPALHPRLQPVIRQHGLQRILRHQPRRKLLGEAHALIQALVEEPLPMGYSRLSKRGH